MTRELLELPCPPARRKIFEDSLSSIKDAEMQKFMDSLWLFIAGNRGLKYLVKYRFENTVEFTNQIKDKTFNDITWDFLCGLVKKKPAMGFYCCHLLLNLLNEGRYVGKYKKHILRLKDSFDVGHRGIQDRYYPMLFCNSDIKYMYKAKSSTSKKYFIIRTDNKILWEILSAFCEKDVSSKNEKKYQVGKIWFYENAASVFKGHESAIHSISDFSYETFMNELNNCLYMSPSPLGTISALQRFYVYLIENPSGEGRNIFLEKDDMDMSALKRDDFAKRIIDGYKFIYYNPLAPVPFGDKWILHINGFDRGSTKLKATTTKAYDFTRIESLFYRDLAKEYFWKNQRSNFNTRYEQFIALIPLINKLTQIKKKAGTPEDRIYIDETAAIRIWIKNSGDALYTINSKICNLKRFLADQEANEKISVELLALDYLSEIGKPHNKDAKAIPEKHVEAINNVMLRHAGESPEKSYCYVIFHILIQTEFRVSQVCHLETGCVSPTMNNNQFIITQSKTSNGQKYQPIITDFTKSLIDDAERLSGPIREACITPDNKKYLFLYKTTENQYIPISGPYFTKYLADCCIEAGVPVYTSSNIRDFHMTKAQELVIRQGYSNATFSILSGHKHVDTTTNHYVDDDLTKIFESMYGVIIGNVDINGNIVEAVPKEINDKKHTVESGCGKCPNGHCIVDSLASCLLCKDFITSLEYIDAFKQLADFLDSCIQNVELPHDKEDLVNRKRLVVAYIIEMESRIINSGDQL